MVYEFLGCWNLVPSQPESGCLLECSTSLFIPWCSWSQAGVSPHLDKLQGNNSMVFWNFTFCVPRYMWTALQNLAQFHFFNLKINNKDRVRHQAVPAEDARVYPHPRKLEEKKQSNKYLIPAIDSPRRGLSAHKVNRGREQIHLTPYYREGNWDSKTFWWSVAAARPVQELGFKFPSP